MLFPSPIPSPAAFSHPGITSLIDALWVTGYALSFFAVLSVHPRVRRLTFGTIHMAFHAVHPRVRPIVIPVAFIPGMKIVILIGTLAAIAAVPPVRRAWLTTVYYAR